MKPKHPTDDFVSRKLAEQTPEFNEAHWEEALAMLESQAKPGRFAWLRRRWALLAAVLLVSSTSFFAYSFYTKGQEQDQVQESSAHAGEQDQVQESSAHAGEQDQVQESSAHAGGQDQVQESSAGKIIEQSNSGQVGTEAVTKAQNKEEHALALGNVVFDKRTDKTSGELSATEGEESSQEEVFEIPVFEKDIELGEGKADILICLPGLFNKKSSPEANTLLSDVNIPDPTVKVLPYEGSAFRRHHLGVMTGFGLARGLGAEAGNGIAPGMGLHYAYTLSPAFRLEAGLGYTIRNGLGGNRTFESVRYGFGSEREESTLDFRQRHLISVPLGINWQAGGRHSIQLGANIARQLNVQGELTTVVTDPFGKETSTVIRQGGYRQAYRPMDVSIQAGYGFMLNNNMDIRLIGQYGLTDLTPDDFWDEVRMDRNVQVKVQLTYHLFHW